MNQIEEMLDESELDIDLDLDNLDENLEKLKKEIEEL